VVQQGQQLLSVADQYRQVVASGDVTGQQARIAADNLERSLQDLERDFYRVSGASTHSQRVLQQISQLVTAARSAPLGRPSQPINRPPVPSWPGYSDVSGLREAVRQFAYGLQRYQHLGPEYANLSRDVQGLMVQIESLDLMIRQGQSRSRVQDAMQSVLKQSDRISSDVRRVDLRTQRGWWDLQVQVDQAARALGIRGRNEVVPSDPVIINRPAWSGMPYQPAGRVPSRTNEAAVQVADELAAKLDEYTDSLRSVRGRPANVNRLIGSLQDLKHAALIFRHVAASGASGNRLTKAADAFMDQYQRTAADYTRVVADDSTLNSPVFYHIGELSQRLSYAARGVRA
jgi:hypothetical protein